jgi:hypothetical protein
MYADILELFILVLKQDENMSGVSDLPVAWGSSC